MTDEARRDPDAAIEIDRGLARSHPEVANWSAWCSDGMRRLDRSEPNSRPDAAMELLKKAQLVFGEKDWSARDCEGA